MSGFGFRFDSRSSLRCLAACVVGCAALLVPATPIQASAEEDPSSGRYIVVLNQWAGASAQVAADHQRQHGADIRFTYRHALKGYAAGLNEQAVAAIQRDPRVAYVEPDRGVETFAQAVPTGIERSAATTNQQLDIDGSDDVRVDVDVAIIDTGIDLDHPDLHIVSSTNCTGALSADTCVAGAGQDDHGHGTHVAGTVGALDNDTGVVGVAPGARLHAVKALTAAGTGMLSSVIAGVDWVTARADEIEVANMSLGCKCASTALNNAIATSVDRGVVHVVAAGNSDLDATNHSPANHPDVITVSALADFDGGAGGLGAPTCRSDEDDTLAGFSNWGSQVEVAAPGVCILSTWLLGGYRTVSGTSMASPHVAGAAAILTSGANDPLTRSDVMSVRDAITASGSSSWVDDSGDGIQEPLLDVGDENLFVVNSPSRTTGGGPAPAPSNEPPVASFTYSCSGLTCSFDAGGSADSDGTISTYAWDLGDGTTAGGSTTNKTYSEPGTYRVTLTVTDDSGASTSTSQDVSVKSEEEAGSFQLTASAFRSGGTATVTLYWRGTDLIGGVVVYRNGVVVATTPDDGSYTEMIANSSGSYVYKVCEEGTSNCSNEVEVF
ncbi:MAG: S8 family serine peptidase [Actinomycetota bacterium]|nr:S8 family serine peptidase [Actinomycetota bacterium]